MDSLNQHRRYACILVTAYKGSVQAARGLVRRAIKKSLNIKTLDIAPYQGYYVPSIEGEDPRFLILVTDDEMEAISNQLVTMAKEEGWTRPPVDCYHD